MKIVFEETTYILLAALSFYLGIICIKWGLLYTGIFLISIPTLTIVYSFFTDFKDKKDRPNILALYIVIAFFLFFLFDAWNSLDVESIDETKTKREFFIPEEWHYLYPEKWFKDLAVLQDDFHRIKYDYQKNLDFQENTFQIYKWFQGWIYSYEAWLNVPVSWEIYLRAFDLLTNTELSKDRLKRDSTLYVSDTLGNIKLFSLLDSGERGDFTIYEWGWWEYYGVRFELWYLPFGPWAWWLQKLLEDYYIIDWWER